MDDLFVIDTHGSATVPVSTAAADYSSKVVGIASAPNRASGFSALKSMGIRIIEDNIGGPSCSDSSSGRNDQAVPKSAVHGLNARFVGLDVGGGSGKNQGQGRGKNHRRRGKGGKGKGKAAENSSSGEPLTEKGLRKQRPPIVESDEEMDEIFDDFVSNIGQEELKRLLKDATNRSGYLSRNIGGGVDYSCPLSDDELENSGQVIDIGNEVDDPFKYEDEVHELLRGGVESSDDDEFPRDLDMENLAEPDVDIQHQSNGPRGRKAAGFKEKDRAKGKHAHEKPSRGGVDAPTSGFDPRTIIKRLDWLAQTEDVGSIWLQPLNKSERQIVHILAREYHVKSKSHGNGARRTPVLTQTPSSCKPTNSRRIRRVLMLYDEGGLIPEQWSGPSVPSGSSRYNGSKAQRGGKGKQGRGRGGNGGGSAQAPLPDGKIVAENAPEVGASNIGHKMLQQMGWQPGQGLGVKEEGRATPVDVMIRAGRRGLGA